MNRASMIFTFSIFVLVISFSYIVIFYSTISPKKYEQISQSSKLTKLPGISFSTPFIENRIIPYDDFSNDFYLGLQKNDFRSFVYAK